MTTLNTGNLATFRLVVQRGSFSAAADALGISQPAVSLQVRQLEQFLQTGCWSEPDVGSRRRRQEWHCWPTASRSIGR